MGTRARRALGLVAALVAAAAVMTAGGAGAGAATSEGPDLSSRAAIESYLQSIGVAPASMTWQTGPLNYAGPNCPGPDWDCTTSTHVVQIAQAAGENRVQCEPGTPGDQTCVIVQTEGTNNHARCTERIATADPEAAQKCVITQAGDRNSAIVHQTIDQNQSPVQDAQQNADVGQTATEKNELDVYQTIKQSSTAVAGAQKQDAHQVVLADQNQAVGAATTGAAGNFAHFHQNQDQIVSGAATLQEQNTEPAPPGFNCSEQAPQNPNQCVALTQEADGSRNESHLHQTIGERATTTATGAMQNQGNVDGGNEGDIHQDSLSLLTHPVDKAHQTVNQRASGPDGTFQSQATDPGCCGLSQLGGRNNLEDVKQYVTQSASSPDAFQFSKLLGIANAQGDLDGDDVGTLQENETQGSGCAVTHHARNNSDSTNTKVSQDAPCLVAIETTCVSGGPVVLQDPEPDPCMTVPFEPDTGCEPDECPPPGPAVLAVLPTSPTFGLPVEEPFFGEPADYTGP